MRKTDQRIDADRVAVLGESYGGWLALEALALAPDRFQAGVAAAPILDLERFIGRAAAWRRKALEAEFGSVTDDRDLLRALSPASRPERVKTPLLLIGGRRDPTTVMAELDSFAKAVRSGSVTADLVAYDDEAHELRRPKNVADSWTKIAAFLKATLKITPVASPPSPSPPSAATP
jgi:dipeptidyl aminopeptidase/acylaminoacyl peptidase